MQTVKSMRIKAVLLFYLPVFITSITIPIPSESSHFIVQTATQMPSSAPTSTKSSFRPTSGPTIISPNKPQSSSSSSSGPSQSGLLAIYIDVPIAFLVLLVIVGYCYLHRKSKNTSANSLSTTTTPRSDDAVFSFGNLYGQEKGKNKDKEGMASSSNDQQNPLLSRFFLGTAKSAKRNPPATASNNNQEAPLTSTATTATAGTGNVQRVIKAIETNQFAAQAKSAASEDLYEEREGPIGKKYGPVRPEMKPVLIVPVLPKEGAPDTLPLTGLSSGDVCTLLESIGMYKAVAEFGKREITGQMLADTNEVEDFAKFEVSDVPEPILKALIVKLSAYKVDGVPSKLVL